MRKVLKLVFIGIILCLLLIYFIVLHPRLPIMNGYAAKKVCSCHFIAHRDLSSIAKQDLNFFPVNYTKSRIRPETQRAETSFFGISKRIAEYHPGLGCTLLPIEKEAVFASAPEIISRKKQSTDTLLWPSGSVLIDSLLPDINYNKLSHAVQQAFGPPQDESQKGTRAVVVVYKNQLIAEKYAEGFDADTEILGWSMTKSIANALVGILIDQNKLALDQTGLYQEWMIDERKNISLEDLLQMSSGLDWDESYGSMSDVTRMLYLSEDIPDMANDPALIHPPGDVWYYSSGTTNLISGIIRQQFNSWEEYIRFPYEALFDKINMSSAIMETDPAGNFVASSYCFATTRDWAKFGLLYLNNGNWFGEQILSEKWINFTKISTPGSGGEYGAHFWHNKNGVAYPDVPHDLISANGFQGQRVFIIPSKEIVIVRMGLTDSEQFDFNQFLKDILACFS